MNQRKRSLFFEGYGVLNDTTLGLTLVIIAQNLLVRKEPLFLSLVDEGCVPPQKTLNVFPSQGNISVDKSNSLISKKAYMNARELGLTQVEAAYVAEISERTGQRIDAGKHRPNVGKVVESSNPRAPLTGVWSNELEPILRQEPRLQPMTLYEYLQEVSIFKCFAHYNVESKPGKSCTVHPPM